MVERRETSGLVVITNLHPEGVPESKMASSYINLHVHIIFATKGRAPSIAEAWRNELHAYIGGIVRKLGAIPFAVGGVSDHIHLFVGLKSTHCVADVVREIKKASSIWASEKYEKFEWQEGYGAFSVSGKNDAAIVAYICQQEEHHKKVSSAEELRSIMNEAGVEFDERYFE